jgi:hypothetical protein
MPAGQLRYLSASITTVNAREVWRRHARKTLRDLRE